MNLLNLSSYTVLSFGCFVHENPIIDWVQEIALRMILEDYTSSFTDLVTMLNEKTISV